MSLERIAVSLTWKAAYCSPHTDGPGIGIFAEARTFKSCSSLNLSKAWLSDHVFYHCKTSENDSQTSALVLKPGRVQLASARQG